MKKHFSSNNSDLRAKIIGLGERSHQKSYYPELMRKLRELERFKAILDQSNDCFFLMNYPDGDFLEAGFSGNDIFFNSDEELSGKRFIDIVATESRNHISGYFADYPDSEHRDLTIELYLQTLDKCKIPFEVKLKKVDFESKFYFIATARDISERKHAESKYLEIFNSASDAMIIYDEETWQILEVNEAAVRMFGFSQKEFKDLKIDDLSTIDHNEIIKFIDEKELLNTADHIFEWQAKRKSNEVFWVEVSQRKSAISGIKRIISVVRDITLRKKSEEKLIEAQKMDSIGNLAAGIAHDFNNMLSGIMGYSSLMLEKEDSSEKIKYLNGVINAAKRAAELTNKLLVFGRRGKSEVEAVCLNDIAVNVLELLKRSIDNAEGIKINADFCHDLWLIDADPAQMSQVIMNLVINAREAIENDGTIQISTANITRDRVFTEKYPDISGDKFVEFIVSDSGSGIEESLRKKIFEPFFSTKLSGQKKGTGLGLAMVYGIVRNHQGTIDLETELGKGTTFRIILPIGFKKVELEKQAVFGENVPGKTLLLVEDDETVLQILDEMVCALGYKTMLATNGQKAVDILRQQSTLIDGVILDMRMPVMAAKEAFKLMRQIKPDIRVMLTTGYGNNEEAQSLLNFGVKSILLKPFNLKGIEDSLRKLLES
ncbi:MAG: PAS domain S-box protein [Candidatus Riflebacteria bacterium]|nr:PAS domain S-box protein [Candidatus Riflebacteria bacterium]